MTRTVNPNKVGVRVTCASCGNQKQPVGRSASWQAFYCDDDCPGYRKEPFIGSLWPIEAEADFGYPVQDAGTRIKGAGE